MAEVKWTSQADADLEEIAFYIAFQDKRPATADRITITDTPAILGMDFAGTVEAVGDGVNEYSIGDEVYGCAGGLADRLARRRNALGRFFAKGSPQRGLASAASGSPDN